MAHKNHEDRLEYFRKYREKNRDKLNSYAKGWRENNPERVSASRYKRKSLNPEKFLLTRAKQSAKERGIYFNISLEDIKIPTHCPVLGVELSRNFTQGLSKDNSPSIDRVDNALGYVKENIRIISWRANSLKSDASLSELEKLVAYIKGHRELQHNVQELSPSNQEQS